jgi:hypothetical protein
MLLSHHSEPNTMNRRTLLVSGLLSGLALPLLHHAALAQAAPVSRRIRGKVVSLEGKTLVVATREGPNVTITVPDNLAVAEVKPLELDAIQPNSYVGIASMKAAGKDVALEVLVFPEAMRGAGEGSFPWDLQPESTMTNASVASVVGAAQGRTLSLTYKDGKRDIMVPPGVPIVTFMPADRSLLVPGAPVFLSAAVSPDGSMSAGRITTGRDGNIPPM